MSGGQFVPSAKVLGDIFSFQKNKNTKPNVYFQIYSFYIHLNRLEDGTVDTGNVIKCNAKQWNKSSNFSLQLMVYMLQLKSGRRLDQYSI